MPDPQLQVVADLTISTTTAAGDVAVGHLTGDGGDTLTLRLDRPDLMGGGLDRRSLGQLADGLAAGGVRVRVVGAHGPLAVVGRTAGNRVGRLVTGSSNVSVTPGRGALAAAWVTAGPRARRVGWAALAGLGLGSLLVAVRRRGTG